MKKKKKRGWLIALTVLTIITVGIVWFLSNHDPKEELLPSLTVMNISITDMDEDMIDVTAKIGIHNPLPVDLSASSLRYSMYIDSNRIAESTWDEPVKVEGGDSSVMSLPVQVDVKKLTSALKKLKEEKRDSANYTIKAVVTLDVPIAGKEQINLDETKRLPAFLMPNVHVKDIDITKVKLKESTMGVAVQIDNPNVFPLRFKDVNYEARINQEHTMHGTVPGVTEIGAQSSNQIPINVSVNNLKMGKLAWKALFDKKDTHVDVLLTCQLLSKNPMLQNSKMVTRASGTLEEVKDMAKKVKNQP